MTPFAWHKPDPNNPKPDRPTPPPGGSGLRQRAARLVVDEVYADIRNTEKDEDDNKITQPYQVKFWIELNNPLFRANLSQPGGPQNIGNEPTGQRYRRSPHGEWQRSSAGVEASRPEYRRWWESLGVGVVVL